MEWSSWFRRSNNDAARNSNQQRQAQEENEREAELLGITHQLIDRVKSFTIDTFKNFPLQDEEAASSRATLSDEILAATSTTSTSANVQKDLSEWQERHAILVLSKVKELSQLRFKLCPGHLKEREFWRIYFTLVRNDIAEYELQAIRLAKLKRMAMGNEESSNTSEFEVEMAETKQAASSEPSNP